MIKPGIYKHYKGKLYKVHYLAKHSETLNEFVVYETLYENTESKYWIRPLAMFTENVKLGSITVPRFTFLNDEI
jgi:hypothetical protein